MVAAIEIGLILVALSTVVAMIGLAFRSDIEEGRRQ